MVRLGWILAATLLVIALGLGVALWRVEKRQQTLLERIDRMLEQAKNGTFCEESFDETMLSRTETHFAEYLAGSAVSARNLKREQDQIKELISDISHQTKTPIANLLLYAQLLCEQPLPEKSAACAAALETQAEKLRFLIESLVKTSRLEVGVFALHPQKTAVQPLLAKAAAEIAPKAAQKGIAVTVLPGDETVTACFDEKWTEEALYNLVDNAVKYTPACGKICLSATAYELFVRLDVADTGIGIEENEQAKVFTRFYRSPAVAGQEGVGLGLYLARQIVSRQGGYCRVRSAPGAGSTFSLFLRRDTLPESSGPAKSAESADTIFQH